MADRPRRVPQRDQCRVELFELSTAGRLLAGVETLLDTGHERVDGLAPNVELVRTGRVAHERQDPGCAPQVGIDAAQPGGGLMERFDSA